MMSIIHKERHFVSDCERALNRLYKEQREVEQLIKLQGKTKHLVYSLNWIKESIDQWNIRASVASERFESGLDVWFNWREFYWREYEGINRRGLFA